MSLWNWLVMESWRLAVPGIRMVGLAHLVMQLPDWQTYVPPDRRYICGYRAEQSTLVPVGVRTLVTGSANHVSLKGLPSHIHSEDLQLVPTALLLEIYFGLFSLTMYHACDPSSSDRSEAFVKVWSQ